MATAHSASLDLEPDQSGGPRLVAQVARQTTPDRVHWCDGSTEEFQALRQELVSHGELLTLNPQTHPVAATCIDHTLRRRSGRASDLCQHERPQADAGPNNHWLSPADAHRRMDELFDGCMRAGRCTWSPTAWDRYGSPSSRCGVEITDSAYVVLNMRIMTRMGRPRSSASRARAAFVKGLHSIGELDPERRFIMHFPEELTIQSFGSGYGGNALLGKKCHALRIASWQARSEGWLAEHMLIVGVENPAGETHYLACAFPSACGKTNLAMLIPPDSMPGWKVWTVGDDIAWLHPGPDGRLWRHQSRRPGYFGVVPGTNAQTNRNAYEMIQQRHALSPTSR